jgi:hypothetical protein
MERSYLLSAKSFSLRKLSQNISLTQKLLQRSRHPSLSHNPLRRRPHQYQGPHQPPLRHRSYQKRFLGSAVHTKRRASTLELPQPHYAKSPTPNPGSTAASPAPPKSIKTETSNNDVVMIDPQNELLAPLPASYELTRHPGDKDPLLIVEVKT